jgi:hypothetical protein
VGGSGSPIWYSGAYVGIATTSPLTGLHISNPDTADAALTVGGGFAGEANTGGEIHFRTDAGSEDTVGGAAIRGLNQWGGEANGQDMDLAFYTNLRTGTDTYTGLTERMRITDAGQVGIGTASPSTVLHLKQEAPGGIGPTLTMENTEGTLHDAASIQFVDSTLRGQLKLSVDNSPFGADLVFLSGSTGTTEVFRIESGGYVGIGTTDPCTNSQAPANCKLSVAGSIQAYDVTVNNQWADYVFDPGYRLAPLSEVAGYIQQNHHLPDIPSAGEVQEKGVSLGEMQAKLLAKIEELTLHMIQAEEENRQLRERIARLEERDSR